MEGVTCLHVHCDAICWHAFNLLAHSQVVHTPGQSSSPDLMASNDANLSGGDQKDGKGLCVSRRVEN